MALNWKRYLFFVAVGLTTVVPVLSQVTSCRYEGDVQYCENSAGEYLPVSTRASSSHTVFESPTAALSIAVLALETPRLISPSESAFAAQITTPVTSVQTNSAKVSVTALTGCYLHESVQYCTPVPTGGEVVAATQASSDEALPTAYTACHSHDEKNVYCVTPGGQDVLINSLSLVSSEDDNDEEKGGSKKPTCKRPERNYSLKIRIGSLFIVLFTSSTAVFGPMLLRRFSKNVSTSGIRFTMIKQFGTGVIIATAFVHLLTDASSQFTSECLGELDYEATSQTIAMAGAFLSFLVEFIGGRYVMHRRDRAAIASTGSSIEGVGEGKSQSPGEPVDLERSQQSPHTDCRRRNEGHGHGHEIADGDDKMSVWVMEVGIIFHSILIGVTTVVTGDSDFWNLTIVIIFHQMFEGLALGSRISTLSSVTTLSKCAMAAAFSCITPFGMMIGIIVLKNFNESDKSTILALGTLDALSAGILIWVGFVEMWARDWIYGDLKNAGISKTACAMGSLIVGMVLMGLLGKWA